MLTYLQMFPEAFTLWYSISWPPVYIRRLQPVICMYYWGPAGHFYSLWFQSTALNTYNPRIFLPLSDGFLKGSADVSGCVHTYKHKLSDSTFNPFTFSLGAKQCRHRHGGQTYGCTFVSCQRRRTFTEHAWQVSNLGLTCWRFVII